MATFVAVAALAAGCRSSRAPSAKPLPAPPPVVHVTMREYVFDYDPAVPAGRVVFAVRNAGQLVHRLTMVPLPEELPPIAEQLRGQRRVSTGLYAGVPNRKPKGTGTFAVDLVAGRRYAMVCFVRDADGQPHALKGMASEFRAAGAAPAASGEDDGGPVDTPPPNR